MYDLIGVVCANGANQEYVDNLRAAYRNIRDGAVPEWKPEKVEWKEDGTPVLPWKDATQRMVETLAIKKRIESGH